MGQSRAQGVPQQLRAMEDQMITLGFGFSVYNDATDSYDRKFFAFSVPDMSSEEFEDMDQDSDHPDNDEWADTWDEAGSIATEDSCDVYDHMGDYLWADYNVKVADSRLIRGCEILRNFFISKGMACSSIDEYSVT